MLRSVDSARSSQLAARRLGHHVAHPRVDEAEGGRRAPEQPHQVRLHLAPGGAHDEVAQHPCNSGHGPRVYGAARLRKQLPAHDNEHAVRQPVACLERRQRGAHEHVAVCAVCRLPLCVAERQRGGAVHHGVRLRGTHGGAHGCRVAQVAARDRQLRAQRSGNLVWVAHESVHAPPRSQRALYRAQPRAARRAVHEHGARRGRHGATRPRERRALVLWRALTSAPATRTKRRSSALSRVRSRVAQRSARCSQRATRSFLSHATRSAFCLRAWRRRARLARPHERVH